MKYYVECDLRHFEAWSGGRDTMNDLEDEELDRIEFMLDDYWIEVPSDTDINDFLWFERNTIAEWLGYADWDDLMEDDGR